MKNVIAIENSPERHWVGDGFPVRSMFSYHANTALHSPFLLLDHAGPMEFTPTERPRGVGVHPHRGFETVTIVYDGEVAHRDSTGAGGTIGPGDVQWMTAGAGILHEEFHSPAFTKSGGTLEMVQLWVNLPAADKSTPPAYQTIVNDDIPEVALPNDSGTVRVIAGDFDGHAGPANTHTPMNVWDLRLAPDSDVSLSVPDGHTLSLVILDGAVQINGNETANTGQLVVFNPQGSDITLRPQAASKVLLLSGEQIDEPVVGYGPFVMNSEAEIREAVRDFNSGRFGQIPAAESP